MSAAASIESSLGKGRPHPAGWSAPDPAGWTSPPAPLSSPLRAGQHEAEGTQCMGPCGQRRRLEHVASGSQLNSEPARLEPTTECRHSRAAGELCRWGEVGGWLAWGRPAKHPHPPAPRGTCGADVAGHGHLVCAHLCHGSRGSAFIVSAVWARQRARPRVLSTAGVAHAGPRPVKAMWRPLQQGHPEVPPDRPAVCRRAPHL